MNDETAPCPKCGNLCQLPKGGFNSVYIIVCIVCFSIGFITDLPIWIGGIACIFLVIYDNSIKNKPIQCPKCDFTFRR